MASSALSYDDPGLRASANAACTRVSLDGSMRSRNVPPPVKRVAPVFGAKTPYRQAIFGLIGQGLRSATQVQAAP
jgi:hypothetical protein